MDIDKIARYKIEFGLGHYKDINDILKQHRKSFNEYYMYRYSEERVVKSLLLYTSQGFLELRAVYNCSDKPVISDKVGIIARKLLNGWWILFGGEYGFIQGDENSGIYWLPSWSVTEDRLKFDEEIQNVSGINKSNMPKELDLLRDSNLLNLFRFIIIFTYGIKEVCNPNVPFLFPSKYTRLRVPEWPSFRNLTI